MGVAAASADFTIPKLLLENQQKWTDKVWMRKKELGFWREYTWREACANIKDFSLGLMSLGFQRGDVMAILGDNDPHWFWAQLAAQAAGGMVTGVFSSSGAREVKYFLEHSDARVVVAQDQEQVDKILEIKSELPLLKKVIYWDAKGLRGYDDPILASFDSIRETGVKYGQEHPGAFEESVAKGRMSDLALLMYTSGTTGLPKAAMVSYASLIASNTSFYSMNPITEDDEWVSFILPGWSAEQGLGLLASLNRGVKMSFPESQTTVQENIREIGATVLMYPSRLWEMTAATIQNKIAETTFLKRQAFRLALPIAYRVADAKFSGQKLGWAWLMPHSIARLLVLDPLRDKLGLLRIRVAFTAGSALGPDVFRLITAIGVDLRQLYGMTEIGVSQHTATDIKVDSVGVIYPGTMVRITDNGEILARGGSQVLGYYKNDKATEEAFAGGWYHTGDAGHLDDDGHLYFLDRVEYMSRLADGTQFAPQYIESRLKFSPYIKDAFVVGDESRSYIGAAVNINYDNVGHWAEKKRITYTTFADLSQKPEVCRLISGEVKNLNAKLPGGQRIHRFINMPKELDPDEAELTRTMKLRRRLVEERYQDFISALYGGKEKVAMDVPVFYRDGRRAVVKAEITVNQVN
ncbi:MAG: long-chain fatty acid--CoA ligase [Chloroflexi bacterium]|nr:long-chain fatty acid--CoA ligase [Chloroflexota bacterium]